MAKTSKNPERTAGTQGGSASVLPSANNPDKDTSIASTNGKVSGPRSSKTTGKSRAAAKRATLPAGKTPRTRKPRTVNAGCERLTASRRSKISDDDIRLRAYFIAERRLQSGVPGDSTEDWWEAHPDSCRRKRAEQLASFSRAYTIARASGTDSFTFSRSRLIVNGFGRNPQNPCLSAQFLRAFIGPLT